MTPLHAPFQSSQPIPFKINVFSTNLLINNYYVLKPLETFVSKFFGGQIHYGNLQLRLLLKQCKYPQQSLKNLCRHVFTSKRLYGASKICLGAIQN